MSMKSLVEKCFTYIQVIILVFILGINLVVEAAPFEYEICNLGWQHVYHKHNEESYQKAWCKIHGGILEYENKDKTRVDCLTDTHAVEFDFANKWQEAIGQALHYSIMTGKRAKVVLILDNPRTQMIYFRRIQKTAEKYNFDVEYITNKILNIDSKGKCDNPNCKCHEY